MPRAFYLGLASVLACSRSAPTDAGSGGAGPGVGADGPALYADHGDSTNPVPVRTISWSAGKRYLFEVRSSVLVEFGGAGSAVSYDMTARASVSVIRPEPERTTLYLKLSDSVLRNRVPGGERLDRVGEDIQRGDAVLVLVNGGLSEFGTRRGISKPASATYRQIASALQVRLPDSGTPIEVEEYDGTGRYLARYVHDRSGPDYAKAKLHYAAMLGVQPGPAGSAPGLRAEVIKSQGHVGLATGGGLASISLQDEIAIRGSEVPVHSVTSLELRLLRVEDEMRAGSELSTLAGEIPLLAASEPDLERPAVEALDRARTQGAQFRDILAKLKAAQERVSLSSRSRSKAGHLTTGEQAADDTDSDSAEARKQFASLVGSIRVQADAVADAVKLINTGSPLTPVLIDALSSASNRASEDALIGLLHSSKSDVAKRALFGLSRQPRPGERSLGVMYAVLADKPFDETALYALAGYSRRFRDAGQAEQADKLGEYLTKRLSEASGPTSRVIALHAIEGSAYSGAAHEVLKFVKDPDETIRAAAIRALGPMKDPSIDDILVSKLSSDSSPETRLAVVLAARSRKQSIKVAGAIARIFKDCDTTVRYRAVELFLNWLPEQPELRKLLDRIASTDPDLKIRELAKVAL